MLNVDGDGKDGPLVPVSVLERFDRYVLTLPPTAFESIENYFFLRLLTQSLRIDFLMTNPPFYPTHHALLLSQRMKSRPPSSICTGSPTEMITPGGEVGFVTRLITQSLQPEAKTKVQWWSSMLGKLSSVGSVVERLKTAGCRNWAVTEFIQGSKTRRWGVAWSWRGLRPRCGVARGVGGRAFKRSVSGGGAATTGGVESAANESLEQELGRLEGGLLPFPAEFELELQCPRDGADEVGARINTEIGRLDLKWQWKPALGIGLGIAEIGDCWSRKARRRLEHRSKLQPEKEDEEMEDSDDEDEDKEPELVFKIHVRQRPEKEENEGGGGGGGGGGGTAGGVAVMVRWLQGHDHVLFESFCGWLKRKVDLEWRQV